MLPRRLLSIRYLIITLIAVFSFLIISSPAYALGDYVKLYLEATEPVSLDMDRQGNTKLFSEEDLSTGKELFEKNCLNCHVGGETLPFPPVSLALDTLAGATPPRNNINGIVNFLRQPMTYDGYEETYWCREVSENWMPQETIEKLAAFVLRAAQKAPGWGVAKF
ncbi:MAG: photosystem II cytochrome PsbV2 [Symploca sp. SIO2D2]|nr:photosystem II cytochrome PsbV2 [Symploca sp. SIO2D2]